MLHRSNLQENIGDNSPWPGASGKVVRRAASFFATAFDPIFRWLLSSVISRDPTVPDFLLPSPCACADDFAVAASSFRTLMAAVSSCVQGGGPDCWDQRLGDDTL